MVYTTILLTFITYAIVHHLQDGLKLILQINFFYILLHYTYNIIEALVTFSNWKNMNTFSESVFSWYGLKKTVKRVLQCTKLTNMERYFTAVHTFSFSNSACIQAEKRSKYYHVNLLVSKRWLLWMFEKTQDVIVFLRVGWGNIWAK